MCTPVSLVKMGLMDIVIYHFIGNILDIRYKYRKNKNVFDQTLLGRILPTEIFSRYLLSELQWKKNN